MKQDQTVSKFLRLSASHLGANEKKRPEKTPSAPVICEVLAVAPAGSKKKGFSLHKSVGAFKPLVQKLVDSEEFAAASGACLVRFFRSEGAAPVPRHLLVVGTGLDKSGLNALGSIERLRRLGGSVAQKLKAEKIKTALIHLDSFITPAAKISVDAATAAYAFSEGMGLALYRFDKYFSKKDGADAKSNDALDVTFVSAEASRVAAFEKGLAQARALLVGAYICRDLSNEPSNELTPVTLSERAKKLASEYGLKITILDEKAMAKEKMGLLLGVGQGSVNPPRLIVLEYNPPKKTNKTIAFVGKGITFDSGGISIKPSARMEDMKHDMSGAAAVLGAIASAALVKAPVRIICVVAAAENMPSGNAIQPGNILISRAGKTVEINNTDAEGRLVLADALDYVQDMKPNAVINLATLTGAITVAIGKAGSGLMTNNASFARQVAQASLASGERVIELPLFDEYFDDLKSEFADMRNSGDGPSHGAQKGGMFLKEYIRKGTPWVHLDIAAMAYGLSGFSYVPRKTSSGWGVRLLVELAKGFK